MTQPCLSVYEVLSSCTIKTRNQDQDSIDYPAVMKLLSSDGLVVAMIKSSLSFKQVTDMNILLTQMFMVVCSSRRQTHLAISARLFASSAMRLMSLKVFLSENILVSADWRPCSVRCSAAHAAERASFPKSFLLVKAVYKN